jgi:hypothetical protein
MNCFFPIVSPHCSLSLLVSLVHVISILWGEREATKKNLKILLRIRRREFNIQIAVRLARSRDPS